MSELFPLTEGWCMSNNSFGAEGESFDSNSALFETTFLLLNPAEIWLDWLKDEIRLTEEEPNREKVYELFERAVKDYLCEYTAPSSPALV